MADFIASRSRAALGDWRSTSRFTIRSSISGWLTSRKNCASNQVTSRRISARFAADPLIIAARSTVSSKYSQIAPESISTVPRSPSTITGV